MALALMAALPLMDPDSINKPLLQRTRHSPLEPNSKFVSSGVPLFG
jgi:hypothetical protein